VSGYVLIAHVRASVIPLRSLRVIRGKSLLHVPNDPSNRGYSLYVANNYVENSPGLGLMELQLTALRGECVVLCMCVRMIITVNT